MTRMVRSLLVCSLVLLGSTICFGQTLVWSDEFDDTALDTSIWTYEVGGHGFGNGELQYYTSRPENVYLEDGYLVIEARRESYEGLEFTSGRLKTAGRLAFKYGSIEARIKVPDLADGLWPAFWLLGNNLGQASWPACGEIDILEMGMSSAIQSGLTNRRYSAAAHWDANGSYASYGLHRDSAVDMNDDFHIFRLDWTPQELAVSMDGNQFWALDISDPDASSLHEMHERFFVILNLAVGGYNFVDITDPNNITAPFPAKMYIDYVRLYDNGDTELYLAGDTAETGNFGVFTDTTPVSNHLAYDVDSDLFIWNNMAAIEGTPYEGDNVWAFSAGADAWFGMGAYCREDRNMMNYAYGNIHFHMKLTDTRTLSIGVASSAGGEGWVDLVDGDEQYGLVRDGQWHEVVLPCTLFAGVDFNTISQMFMLTGDAGPAMELEIDNVYWEPSEVLPTPENGNFGLFTETASHKDAGEMVLEEDGHFYVWENTLQALTGDPYDGEATMAFTSSPGLAWFGAAFTPNVAYNLTAYRYPESNLHFALKTSSTVAFQIGMKSGTVDGIGQKWITFENGNDPYGFVRDGQWHIVEIPMSDFTDTVNLAEVTQLFELLGDAGPISDIEFDDICFTGGGTAINNGQQGEAPVVDAGSDVTMLLPENSTTLVGSATDNDGTVDSLLWTQISGPTTATISGENTSTLFVSDLVAGAYIFRLSATDNEGLVGSDNVVVRVNDPVPTANAGSDVTIEYPLNIAIIQGDGSDVDGTIESYEWSFVDGPALCRMIGVTSSRLIARELIPGEYIFRLTVTDDDGLTGSDEVSVNVVSPSADNLALNKPATCSSQEGGYVAGNAVDGDTGTRWGSAFEDPSWIMVDLEAVYAIDQVVLNWEAASSKVYDIEVSDDASTWTSIYHTDAGGNGIETLDVSGSGRYIRMYGTERNLPYGHSLWEFEVYGASSTPGDGDGDGDVDLDDWALFTDCHAGPGVSPTPTAPMTADDCLAAFDAETGGGDGDVDLWDYAVFMSRIEQ